MFSKTKLWNCHVCFLSTQVDRTGMIPMLRFRDRDSYATNKTKEYDDLAMKYLTYVLLFLAVCFSIYSLKYERHKSWYSWILSSLTSCVYMFGKHFDRVFRFFFHPCVCIPANSLTFSSLFKETPNTSFLEWCQNY